MLHSYALKRIEQIDKEIARLDNLWDEYDNKGLYLERGDITRELGSLNVEKAGLEQFLKLPETDIDVTNPHPQTTALFSNASNSSKPEIISHVG